MALTGERTIEIAEMLSEEIVSRRVARGAEELFVEIKRLGDEAKRNRERLERVRVFATEMLEHPGELRANGHILLRILEAP